MPRSLCALFHLAQKVTVGITLALLLLPMLGVAQGLTLRFPELVETRSGERVRFRVEVNRNVADTSQDGAYELALIPTTAMPGARLDSLTGEFLWPIRAQHEGRDYTFAIRLLVDGRVIAQQTGRIRVSNEVPAPHLQLPKELLLESNRPNPPLQLDVSDPAGRDLRITVTSTLPNTVQYRAERREIVFPIQTEGQYTVTVVADNGVKRESRDMQVKVARSNVQRPPIFYADADQITILERERINIMVKASDPNSDPIFYSIRNPQDLVGQARVPDNQSPTVEWTAISLANKDEETYVMEVVADDRIAPNPPIKRVTVTVKRNITFAEQNKRTEDYLREFNRLAALEQESLLLYDCVLKRSNRSQLTRRLVGGLTVTASLVGGVLLLTADNQTNATANVGWITTLTGFISGLQNVVLPQNINQDLDALFGINREILQFRSEEQVMNRDNLNQLSRTEDFFRVYRNLLIRNMVFEGRIRPIAERVKKKCK